MPDKIVRSTFCTSSHLLAQFDPTVAGVIELILSGMQWSEGAHEVSGPAGEYDGFVVTYDLATKGSTSVAPFVMPAGSFALLERKYAEQAAWDPPATTVPLLVTNDPTMIDLLCGPTRDYANLRPLIKVPTATCPDGTDPSTGLPAIQGDIDPGNHDTDPGDTTTPKKKSGIWGWVIGAAAVIGGVAYVASRDESKSNPAGRGVGYMRAHKNGRVSVSEDGIDAFRGQWPASGLYGLRGVTFTFESNGDLVDIDYANGDSDRWDGPALAALSQDAQEYGSLVNDTAERSKTRGEFRKTTFPWWWPDSWGR